MTNLVIWPRIEGRLLYRRIHGLTHWRIGGLVSGRILRRIHRTCVSVVLWGVVGVSWLGWGDGWRSIVIALRLGWIGWRIGWISSTLLDIGEGHPSSVFIIRFV